MFKEKRKRGQTRGLTPFDYDALKFFFLFLILFSNSAAKAVPKDYRLVPTLSVDIEAPAFQKLTAASPGSREAELAKIEYLLERIGNSPYNFIRNGSRYQGKRAEVHLRWKYLRSREQIKTAEDFIQRVATRSKISGEAYEVILPDKTHHPLREFLSEEIHLLNQALEEKH